jgi:transcriptional regulator with XRE-family HTH domain
MKFGERLRKKRKEQRLSQRVLAAQLGIDFTYLCLIESGRRYPSPKITPELAHFLGIPSSNLLRIINDEKTYAQEERIKEGPFISNAEIEARAYSDREAFLSSVARDYLRFPRDRERIAQVLCNLSVREDDVLFSTLDARIYAGLFLGQHKYQDQKNVIVVARENVRSRESEETSEQTKLFHAMHEVGHYRLHWPTYMQQGPMQTDRPLYCSSGDTSPMELQASAYASAFLMPRSEIFYLLNDKKTFHMRRDGRALCEHFYVEPWMLGRRLSKLGINVVE